MPNSLSRVTEDSICTGVDEGTGNCDCGSFDGARVVVGLVVLRARTGARCLTVSSALQLDSLLELELLSLTSLFEELELELSV